MESFLIYNISFRKIDLQVASCQILVYTKNIICLLYDKAEKNENELELICER